MPQVICNTCRSVLPDEPPVCYTCAARRRAEQPPVRIITTTSTPSVPPKPPTKLGRRIKIEDDDA